MDPETIANLFKIGGGVGYVFGTVMVLDRLGFLRRKNNLNGHAAFDPEPIVKAIRESSKEVAEEIRHLRNRAEDNTNRILDALRREP